MQEEFIIPIFRGQKVTVYETINERFNGFFFCLFFFTIYLLKNRFCLLNIKSKHLRLNLYYFKGQNWNNNIHSA